MRLSSKDFKRLLDLQKKLKTEGKLTDAEASELAKLSAAKEQGKDSDSKRKGGKKTDRDKGEQDPAWWSKYKELVEGASNFPFNTIKGVRGKDLPNPSINFQSLAPVTPSTNVNGVRIEYLRSPGKIVDANSGYNYQMRALWLQMHRKYRGLGSYEFADLGVVIWAMINAFVDLARAERIYGACSYYRVRNRSIPDQLLDALMIDHTAIDADSLARLRYAINRIVVKAKTLNLPKGLSVLQSFIELESNIFSDGDSERSDWFVYDTDVLWYYEPTALYGGCVATKARKKTTTYQSFDDIISDLDLVFDALLLDTDVARVCSDLLACFGDNGVVTLAPLPEMYEISKIRRDDRLLQLHNTTICGNVFGRNMPTAVYNNIATATGGTGIRPSISLYQMNGIMFFDLDTVCREAATTMLGVDTTSSVVHIGVNPANVHPEGYYGDAPLNIWKDEVSTEDKIEMTRQTVIKGNPTIWTNSQSTPSSYGSLELKTFGSIVVEYITFFIGVGRSNGTISLFTDAIVPPLNASTALILAYLDQVDWHPHFILGGTFSGTTYAAIMWDLDNYTYVNSETLSALHDAALMSGFKFDDATLAKG